MSKEVTMKSTNRRALLGLFLVFLGAFFLLENLHMLPRLPYYFFRWYTLVFALGVFNLIAGNRTPAVILIGIGILFALEDIFYLDFQDFWPVILIIVGLSFIFRQKSLTSDGAADENFFDDLNIFGGSGKQFTSQQLEGGKSTNIFGGSSLDLRQAKLANDATIEVFTMFGGCDIIVPGDWRVDLEITSVFGGFDDKREIQKTSTDVPTLRVKGLVLFGGGDIKSSK
ncbi:MAG: hypothetical protein KI790_10895 [Cyclobacteriaceae bacterium]|nr:hypothetical protein [Cyclobacteriaceae bacterium HetDA_MAG_MS6]